MIKTNTVAEFRLFPKPLPYAEKALRFGISIGTGRLSFNLAIPYLLLVAFYKHMEPKNPKDRTFKNRKDVKQWKISEKIRLGFDRFVGEAALLFPVFKCWIYCEWLGISGRHYKRFSLFTTLFKLSKYELMFQLKITGCGFGIHIPLYELDFVAKLRERQNRKFWLVYGKT